MTRLRKCLLLTKTLKERAARTMKNFKIDTFFEADTEEVHSSPKLSNELAHPEDMELDAIS